MDSYVGYLEDYVTHFGLDISFGHRVVEVERHTTTTTTPGAVPMSPRYTVHCTVAADPPPACTPTAKLAATVDVALHCDAVVVCSGLHNVPFTP